MSENDVGLLNNPNVPTARITIERNSQEEKLQEENDQLKEKMTEIAAIEFAKQCQEYGIDPATSSAYDLEVAKGVKRKTDGFGDTAPLNYQQITGRTTQTTIPLDSETDLTQLEFTDENQLIEALNTLNKKKNPQAKQILGSLAKKAFKNKNQEFVFEGSTKDLMRPDLPITPNMPIEEQKIRALYNSNLAKNRTNWSQES
jgi:hypothetical protein